MSQGVDDIIYTHVVVKVVEMGPKGGGSSWVEGEIIPKPTKVGAWAELDNELRLCSRRGGNHT